MVSNKFVFIGTRIPVEAVKVIEQMSPGRPAYSAVRDIVVAYAMSAKHPPLRDDTMKLLYSVVELAKYGNADALVQDLCRSFERAMRANRGELREDEAEVDNDILEMFKSVVDEKELTIRKHT